MNRYWIWLSSVCGLRAQEFDSLVDMAGSAEGIWRADRRDIMECVGEAAALSVLKARNAGYFDKLFENIERAGVKCVTRRDPEYPRRLLEIYDPPPTLYVKGEADLNSDKMLAIVGTRKATADGLRAAREFAREAARSGVCVVSGLAIGIDSLAHRGALEGPGVTIGVIANGAGEVYPKSNERLAAEILAAGGAIVGEIPPGEPIRKWSFPARNRIISGMTDASLIVEAGFRSGSMITARLALEQGREVFAVPGSIYSENCEGVNNLIFNGAPPALDPYCVLEAMKWANRPERSVAPERIAELTVEEKIIRDNLRREKLNADELHEITKISLSRVNSILTMLEMRGIIVKADGGGYRAR